MREQLSQYVELLFAGARGCEDIKQEILQNTLDRYDDLVAAGKVPEAAYRLAIAGIGDINEILGTNVPCSDLSHPAAAADDGDTQKKKLLRAIAVGLYILCPLPLILLSEMGLDILGLCGTLAIAAVATVLILLGAKKESQNSQDEDDDEEDTPQSELGKSLGGLIWAIGLAIYFLVSFSTNCWHITWVIFPILGALDDLVKAMIRKREALHSDVMFPSKQRVRKGIKSLIWAVGFAIYFIFSFATGAWYISWLLFPIIGAVQGRTVAFLDLKEAMKYET